MISQEFVNDLLCLLNNVRHAWPSLNGKNLVLLGLEIT